MMGLSAANSRIKDVDVAKEPTEYARSNILVQSGRAMLGQTNALPSMTLLSNNFGWGAGGICCQQPPARR